MIIEGVTVDKVWGGYFINTTCTKEPHYIDCEHKLVPISL